MKPRTNPTGTLRAASGLRVAAPALLFLFGTLLAALWLLAAPAQAETLSDPLGNLGLERVEEVTTPVVDTLGTVHQRVEKGTGEAAASAVALPEPAVTEVRGEVRGVVTEIDRTREEAGDHGLVPPLVEPDAPTSGTATERSENGSSDSSDPATTAEAADGTTEDPTAPDTLPTEAEPVRDHEDAAPEQDTAHAEAATVDPGDAPRTQATTGSTVSSANAPTAAPAAVAGYLAVAALPDLDSGSVLVRARAPHATPADPAADPTVSPD
ncbi:hypothetical protein [Nocardiopsis sp. MG754419]|uniref:hypothetical protein n=1 Tax=Nocardiopsis sp. MG754419 TaxID=2259865 RepID=UPI001BA57368|nr:hypothetical protein [Nocardiopsis sp. MG754419]MBR8745175.1 hypothetical protein [Nocardiopsis sp. MG754419]